MQGAVVAVGVPWSDQVLDIWIELSPGYWRVERRGIPFWNFAGNLRPHPRLCKGAYLFPAGMSPLEEA